MKEFLIACFMMTVAASTTYAAVYKWVDEEGIMHFSDQPPPTGIKNFETGRARGGQTDDTTAGLPYALQEPVKNFPVVLYISACGGPCEQARLFLQKRGVPHAEKDASDPAVQTEMSKLLGGDTIVVPLLTVGRTLQRGYEENIWNAALDGAGYPKNSVLPPKQAAPTRPTIPVKKAADEDGSDSKDGNAPVRKSTGQYPIPQ